MHIAAKERIEAAKLANVTPIAAAQIPVDQQGDVAAYIKTQILSLCQAALEDTTLSDETRGKLAALRSRVEIEL